MVPQGYWVLMVPQGYWLLPHSVPHCHGQPSHIVSKHRLKFTQVYFTLSTVDPINELRVRVSKQSKSKANL